MESMLCIAVFSLFCLNAFCLTFSAPSLTPKSRAFKICSTHERILCGCWPKHVLHTYLHTHTHTHTITSMYYGCPSRLYFYVCLCMHWVCVFVYARFDVRVYYIYIHNSTTNACYRMYTNAT